MLQSTVALERVAAADKSIPLVVILFYFAAGMAPISALALAIFGLWSLPLGTLTLVIPALLGSLGLGLLYPTCGRLAFKGFVIGLIAVTLYDSTRLPFVLTGLWGDFIPKIGGWLLDQSEPNWIIGYLWRYLGNGGGMGMAFTVPYIFWRTWHGELPSRLQRSVQARRQRRGTTVALFRPPTLLAALSFGVGVWGCLLLTLLFAPHGETLLFPLTPFSFGLSLVGHLVYGGVLGGMIRYLGLEEGL